MRLRLRMTFLPRTRECPDAVIEIVDVADSSVREPAVRRWTGGDAGCAGATRGCPTTAPRPRAMPGGAGFQRRGDRSRAATYGPDEEVQVLAAFGQTST